MKRCQFCGAYLDAGETCDCQTVIKAPLKIDEETPEELKLVVVPFKPIPKIEFNKVELETKLRIYLSKYDNLVITKDMTVDMKKERSELNKLIKALNAEKIRQKKIFTEPMLNFETEVKEIIHLVEKAAKNIDVQLKNYEEQEKQEKISKLKKFFDENIGELPKEVTFERIFRKEWENKSESLKSCQNVIKDILFRITKELEQIKKQYPDYYVECEIKYFENFSLIDALELGNVLRQKKVNSEKLETEKQFEEVEKASDTINISPQDAFLKAIEPEKKEKYFKVTFELDETLEALNDLKAYMDSRHLNYRIIK